MSFERLSSDDPVLAVESGVTGRAYLRRVFRELGFNDVTFVEEAAEALRVGRARGFALILVSTSLARGDAFDVFFTIHSEGRNTATPIVFLYREGEEAVARRVSLIGGCGLLRRPVRTAELRRVLEEVLGIGVPVAAVRREAAPAEPLAPDLPGGEGHRLLEEGDCEGAERAFRELLKHHGGSIELYFDLAEVCFARGEGDAAEALLAEAERIDPRARKKFIWRERHFVRRGNRRLRARKCRGAKNEFEGAIVANERSVPGHFGLGESYKCLGDREAAARHFERALSIENRPYDLHVYNRMGISARREKDFEGALRAYDRALTFDGEDPVLYYNKAMVFVAQRLYEPALASLRKALELDPEFAEAAKARRLIVGVISRPVAEADRRIVLSDETRVEEGGGAGR